MPWRRQLIDSEKWRLMGEWKQDSKLVNLSSLHFGQGSLKVGKKCYCGIFWGIAIFW